MKRILVVFVILILVSQPQPTLIRADDNNTDPVLVGAGDIASCGTRGDYATIKLLADLVTAPNVAVFTAGDNAYESGTVQQFHDCYGPTWGRFLSRTWPSPGNHDYVTPGASAYFDYFGKRAGPAGRGYYSYDLGKWHIVSLDSDIDGRLISTQGKWLEADLRAHPAVCILAYWHHPLFASGHYTDRPRDVPALWQILYQYGASVVVNGHIHAYERFTPQTPDGQPDPDHGIREFIVGTGGASLRPKPPTSLLPNSEVHDNSTWGVIKLTLHPVSYDWEFIPTAGGTFTDSGSAPCVSPSIQQ